MQDEHVQKSFQEQAGPFSLQVEGLKDGYRLTLRSDEEQVKGNRRIGAAAVNFAKQAEKAGWKLPWPFRLLLWFWERYKSPSEGVKAE